MLFLITILIWTLILGLIFKFTLIFCSTFFWPMTMTWLCSIPLKNGYGLLYTILTHMWRKFKCFVVNQPAKFSHDFWMLLDQVIYWYYTYILIHILHIKGIMHFRKTGPVFKIDLNWTPPNQILWCDPNLRAQSLPSLRTQFPEIFKIFNKLMEDVIV